MTPKMQFQQQNDFFKQQYCIFKMTTTLFNSKVEYIRPQYKNLLEVLSEPNNIYIGRGRIVFLPVDGVTQRYPLQDSIWANPYKKSLNISSEEILLKYEIYIRELIENNKLLPQLLELKGKNLYCWCVKKPIYCFEEHPIICHGQILMKIINENN